MLSGDERRLQGEIDEAGWWHCWPISCADRA